jgi:hypothetical protein
MLSRAHDRRRRRRHWRQPVFAAAAAALPLSALADKNWNPAIGSGNWSTPHNWIPTLPPSSGDNVSIVTNDALNRIVTFDSTDNLTYQGFRLDNVGGGTNTLLQNANALNAAYEMIGISGIGVYTQNGGTNFVTGSGTNALYIGYGATGAGVYNLSGGSLAVNGYEYVGASGAGTFNQTGGVHTATNFVDLGLNVGSRGVYNLSGGSLTTASLYVGDQGYGTFSQSGDASSAVITSSIPGTGLVLGFRSSAGGTYTLSAGALTSALDYIGYAGIGVFNQSGGTHSVTGSMGIFLGAAPGATGIFNLSGGATSAPNVYVGGGLSGGEFPVPVPAGYGNVNVTAGTLNVAGTIQIFDTSNSAGTRSGIVINGGTVNAAALTAPFWTRLDMVSGTLNLVAGISSNAGNLQIGSNDLPAVQSSAAVNQIGGGVYGGNLSVGSYHPSDPTFVSSYGLSFGGTLSVSGAEDIGSEGNGTFTQISGNNFVNGTNYFQGLFLGHTALGNGTFSLSGGTLTVMGSEYVGYFGTGVFNQSGGTHIINDVADVYGLSIGYSNGASGSYTLTDGSLAVAQYEVIGRFPGTTGNFTQSSGSHTAYHLEIGAVSGATGNYNLSGGSLAVATIENVGVQGIGTFTQTGGTNSAAMAVHLGWTGAGPVAGASSTYNLSGGTLNAGSASGSFTPSGLIVGWDAAGTFNQTNGAVNVFSKPGSTAPHQDDGLLIAYAPGSSGTYNLSGAAASLFVNSDEFVGENGTGAFNQSGGAHSVTSGLYVGYASNSAGSFTLSAGTLNVGQFEYIGSQGTGTFIQTGGVHNVSSTNGFLIIGVLAGSSGTYSLSGDGTLSVQGPEYVGYLGNGVFNQSGGIHTATNGTLSVGGGPGTYNLSGGILQTSTLSVSGDPGSAVFNQSGGTHSAFTVQLGAWNAASNQADTGTYNLSGGTLTSTYTTVAIWQGAASFTQTGGSHQVTTLTIGSGGIGTYNLSGDASSLVVTGAETLGFNPGASGTLNQSGGKHTINSNLYLGYATNSAGAVTLSGGTLSVGQHEIVGYYGAGAFTQSAGTHSVGANLYIGDIYSGSGTFNLAGGTLAVGAYEYVAYSGTGTLNQTGGVHTVANFVDLALSPGVRGAYNFSGGSLTTPSLYVGDQGQGVFSQSAGATLTLTGTNSSDGLYLGFKPGSSGTYSLSGGDLLSAATEHVGYQRNGVFIQTGGNNSIGSNGALILGFYQGSLGTYWLSGTATLNTHGGETIGLSGDGVFNQSGGLHTVGTNTLAVGGSSGSGTYNLSGGVLQTSYVTIGYTLGGTGSAVFNQSGGTHSAAVVTVGGWSAAPTNQADAGSYNLSGGTLTATNVTVAYWPGTASFNQTGGSHQVADLTIGQLGIGTYNLSGDSSSLTVTGTEIVGNSGGAGTLNQTGGTHAVNAPLYVGYSSNAAGIVKLSAGTLVGPSEYVGFQGTGSFWQSGGTNVAAALYVGEAAGSTGRYAMTNGTLTVLFDAYIGFVGSAAFQQSGGAASIAGALHIGQPGGGNATVNLSGGTLAAAATINHGAMIQTGGSSTLGPITGTGSISLGGGPTIAQMTARSFAQSSLTIANNGSLSLTPSAPRLTNITTALSITGNGTLDLANHALLTNTDPTTIKSYLASAYGPNQDWSAPGLTSSVASSNPTQYSLAYASGSDQSAQDAGVPVLLGQTLVQVTLTGDANLDGAVDFFDITQLLGYKYNTGQPASYTDGDLNYDGVVDFFDLSLLLSANYNTGQTYLGASAAAEASPALSTQTTVPEPLTPALGALGLVNLVLRRRRHRRLPDSSDLYF